MADPIQLRLLKQGTVVWNAWRKSHPGVVIDLSGEDLSCLRLKRGVDLSKANLEGSKLVAAILNEASFDGANLRGVSLRAAALSHARFAGATLDGANFYEAFLKEAVFAQTSLREAQLQEAYLSGALFVAADLTGADFSGADLTLAGIRESRITGARLRGCWVYGMLVENTPLEEAIQSDLIVTQPWGSPLAVDDFRTAQFVWSFLGNKEAGQGEPLALLLGLPEREGMLNGLRDALRRHHYAPALFDWSRPTDRSQELLSTLAPLVRFILADIDAPNLAGDLRSLVPDLQAVPIQLLWHGSLSQQQQEECHDLCRYPWVLAKKLQEADGPLDTFSEQIINALEQKAEELARMS
jgi:hypothetical protein